MYTHTGVDLNFDCSAMKEREGEREGERERRMERERKRE